MQDTVLVLVLESLRVFVLSVSSQWFCTICHSLPAFPRHPHPPTRTHFSYFH